MSAPVSEAVQDLRALMREHGLSNRQVAELAGVHVKTVESWLASPDSAIHRRMPPRHLRMIEFQLGPHVQEVP